MAARKASPTLDDDAPPIREFADRGAIWLMGARGAMETVVRLLDEDFTESLDFSTAQRVNRSLIADDLRKRETDVLYRVPHRDHGGEVLVYTLVEHQTAPVRRMAWQVLHKMDMIWEAEERAFLDSDMPEGKFSLSTIIPIVFFTGSRNWTASRRLVDLVAGPAFKVRFTPAFEILFINLSAIKPETLVGMNSPYAWALRVFQAIEGPVQDLEEVVREAVAFLESLPDAAQGDWLRAMHFILLLIRHKRQKQEREPLYEVVMDSAREHREKVKEIVMTDAQELIEQGVKQGVREGVKKGRIEQTRKLLLDLGTEKFGQPGPRIKTLIAGARSLERLEGMLRGVVNASSWDNLLH